MKLRYLDKNTRCFLLIFLSFLWTSSGYLTWTYHLLGFLPSSSVDLSTEVAGYLFQALGLVLFSLAVKKSPSSLHIPFISVILADFVLMAASCLSPNLMGALIPGFGMNVLHGVIAGFYLHTLAVMVEWRRRAVVFGGAYGCASIASWLLSLLNGSNFLRSPYSLIIYALLAAVSAALILRDKDLPAESAAEPGDGERPAASLIALAAAAVLLLSLVKNLGFSFPIADIGKGISLELSRVFYAFGLAAAGFISDRERKYGMILCLSSLGIPFLMIALTNSMGTSIIFWMLNYLLFGAFTVFRVVLFTDIARRGSGLLYLSVGGLLFGRLGDAIGTLACISLTTRPLILVALGALLLAVTIPVSFLLYQRLYLPAPIPEKSEQEVFAGFAARYDLSMREQEILQLILGGQSSSEIAESLYISQNTVKYHVRNILKKTACPNRVSLVTLYRTGT